MKYNKPTHSDCCQALIESHTTSYSTYDRCSNCQIPIAYALVGEAHLHWEESNGVCELYNGELYFFWQQMDCWEALEESKQQYVGQIKSVVATVQMLYGCNSDEIPFNAHKRFSNNWKKQVKNPEMAL